MKKCVKPVDVSKITLFKDYESGFFGLRYIMSWRVRVSFNDFDKKEYRLPHVLCGHISDKRRDPDTNQLRVTYEFRDSMFGNGSFCASRFRQKMLAQINEQKVK